MWSPPQTAILSAGLLLAVSCRSSQPLVGADAGRPGDAGGAGGETSPTIDAEPDAEPGGAERGDGLDRGEVGDAGDAGGDAGDAGRGAACGQPEAPSQWAAWAMPRPAGTGLPGTAAYDTGTAGVVIDKVTTLVWQRDFPADRNFDWFEAQDYCGCLSLAGKDDWRLPSRIELVTLADYTRANPAIDPAVFPGTPNEWFWSASPEIGSDPPAAWYVAFFDGNTHRAALEVGYRVRCVRGGPSAPDRLPQLTLGPELVSDGRTGLTWQRNIDGTARTFPQAKSHCASLPLAGGGWRLPDMKELQTLIDEARFDPAIDTAIFPGTPSEGFWASHPLVETPGFAWFVSFEAGIAYNSPEDHPYQVRCVR